MGAPKGPFGRLPRPPATGDQRQWGVWFNAIYQLLSGIPGLSWSAVDKSAAKLEDLAIRPHSALQEITQASDTSSSTDTGKHVTDAQLKKYEDHRLIDNGNPHGTDHAMLEAIVQADDTSANTDGGKHVTDALVKKYEDHRNSTAVHHVAMAAQADSTAADVAGLVTDFNALLAKLRTTGRMAP